MGNSKLNIVKITAWAHENISNAWMHLKEVFCLFVFGQNLKLPANGWFHCLRECGESGFQLCKNRRINLVQNIKKALFKWLRCEFFYSGLSYRKFALYFLCVFICNTSFAVGSEEGINREMSGQKIYTDSYPEHNRFVSAVGATSKEVDNRDGKKGHPTDSNNCQSSIIHAVFNSQLVCVLFGFSMGLFFAGILHDKLCTANAKITSGENREGA